jgi:serine/threonine protein kinase
MDDLVNKIEEGKYKVPTSLSTEVVSFLNGMLQYEPKERLTCEELYNHQFLRSNIKDFHKLDLTQVSDKVKDGKLVMETKKDKNRTIWSVFNENDKLLKISPGRAANPPANSGPVPIKHQNTSEPGNNNNININNNPAIKSANTFQMYSHPNINNYIYSQQNYNNPYSGPILPRGNQAIPGMQIYQNPAYYSNPPPNSNVPNYSNPSNYSSPPMAEVDYSFRGGIYGNLGK